jgi:hypothetical protein
MHIGGVLSKTRLLWDREMIKYGILGAIFLLVTTAVIATFRSNNEAVNIPALSTNANSPQIEQRLSYLEEAIAEERELRIKLESEVASLRAVTESGSEEGARASGAERLAALAGEEGLPEDLQAIRDQIAERRSGAVRESAEERVLSNLVEAGFDEFQAEQIVRATEEVQMDLLNARYEAQQNGEEFNAFEMQAAATAQLRANLGEVDYERYLEATNQPTSVGVSNVLASSPAEIAGMQSGDEIIGYNGERVYNVNELNRLISSAEASGNVIVEVLRDGESVSLSVPAGPIGITSGRGGPTGRR